MNKPLVIDTKLNNNGQLEIKDFEEKLNWVDTYLEENKVYMITNDQELKENKETRARINKLIAEIQRYRIDNINDIISVCMSQFKTIEDKLDERQKALGKEIKTYTDSKKVVVVETKHKITATLKFYDEQLISKIQEFATANNCELSIK